MTVGALALDFGGTLARPGPRPTGEVVAAALKGMAGTRIPDGFAPLFDTVHQRVREADRANGGHTPFAEEIRRTARECGAVVPDPEGAVPVVFTALPDAEVDPEAARALRLMRETGLVCVMAADTERPEAVRRRTLERAGIGHCFDALVLSSELGVRKPNPAFYAAVVEAADCPPQEILFVGNTPDKDILGPRAHGMRSVLVAPDGRPPGLDERIPVIAHFADLPSYLARRAGA
ncbi:hypothetical protein GCM10012280_18280 [Wenjunlia tyrosinilytica]|uniref:HAD family hydrolase n=2 Tax=Wenjunlia tyrosinilytica TaxID=1544741 RepID=A0A917ZLD0_9ACTN|nr:hypothetical protein GCM10012280_18280 [Wenjunlia tyrosinilytica]